MWFYISEAVVTGADHVQSVRPSIRVIWGFSMTPPPTSDPAPSESTYIHSRFVGQMLDQILRWVDILTAWPHVPKAGETVQRLRTCFALPEALSLILSSHTRCGAKGPCNQGSRPGARVKSRHIQLPRKFHLETGRSRTAPSLPFACVSWHT